MLLTSRAARRRARDAYFTAEDQASAFVAALNTVADPAERAGILRELSVTLHNLADLRIPAWGYRDRAAAVRDRDDGQLADLVAGIERARAAYGVRPRSAWAEVEQLAGELLDRLADPSQTDSVRTRLYVQLQETISPTLVGGEILATISRSHRHLAGETETPIRPLGRLRGIVARRARSARC